MVTIKDVKTVKKEDGTEFHLLIVEGGVQPVLSKRSGRLYFTIRTASVPTTFDLKTCKSLIGTAFNGEVKKIQCDPYSYIINDTKEVIELSHRYEFVDENLQLLSDHVLDETRTIM